MNRKTLSPTLLALALALAAAPQSGADDVQKWLDRGVEFGESNHDPNPIDEDAEAADTVPGYMDTSDHEVNKYYGASIRDLYGMIHDDSREAVTGEDATRAAALAWEKAQEPPRKFLSTVTCTAERNRRTETCTEAREVSVTEVETHHPYECPPGGEFESDAAIWQAEAEAVCGKTGDAVVVRWRAGARADMPAWTEHRYTEESGVEETDQVSCDGDGRCTFAATDGFYDLALSFPEPLPFEEAYREIDTEQWVSDDCSSLENDETCSLDSTTCLEGPETRRIGQGGMEIKRDCWSREHAYACEDAVVYEEDTCNAWPEKVTQTCEKRQEVTVTPGCTEGTVLDTGSAKKKKSRSTHKLRWTSEITATCGKNGVVEIEAWRRKEKNTKYKSDGWRQKWKHFYEATVETDGTLTVHREDDNVDISFSCDGTTCTMDSLAKSGKRAEIRFDKPSRTIESEWVDDCGSTKADDTCTLTDSTCTEGGEWRDIDGVSVYRSCWATTEEYECNDTGYIEEARCQDLRDAGCTEIDSACTDAKCAYTYSCPQPQTYTTETCTEDLEITTRLVRNHEAYTCAAGEVFDEAAQVWKAEAEARCGTDGESVALKRRIGLVGDMPAWTRDDYAVDTGVPETHYITCDDDECTYAVSGTHHAIDVSFPIPKDRWTSHLEEDADRWVDNTCAGLDNDPTCERTAAVCTEPEETRNIDGLDVTKDCWAYEYEYGCYEPGYTREPLCTEHEANGCQEYSEECEPGQCTITYQCPTQMLAVADAIAASASAEAYGIEAEQSDCTTAEKVIKEATYKEETCWAWRNTSASTCRESPRVTLDAWCPEGNTLDNPSKVIKTKESTFGTDKRWITSIKAVCGEAGRVNITGKRKKRINATVFDRNWKTLWETDFAATVNWQGELTDAVASNDQPTHEDQCISTRDHRTETCNETLDIAVKEVTTEEQDTTTTPYSCTPGERFDSDSDSYESDCRTFFWFYTFCTPYEAEAESFCGADGQSVVVRHRAGEEGDLPAWDETTYTESSGVEEYKDGGGKFEPSFEKVSCDDDGSCEFTKRVYPNYRISVSFPEPRSTTTTSTRTDTHREIDTETWVDNGCTELKEDSACTQVSDSCTEGRQKRHIDGLDVIRDCWRYDYEYDCEEDSYTPDAYCEELDEAGCTVTAEECTDQRCDLTYTCPNEPSEQAHASIDCGYDTCTVTLKGNGRGSNSVTFDRPEKPEATVEITGDCDAYADDSACTAVDSRCTDDGGTRDFSGVEVEQNCWEYEHDYVCQEDGYTKSAYCGPLDNTCELTGESCDDDYCQYTYTCEDTPAVTETVEDCTEGRDVTIAKMTFDTDYEKSESLGQVAASMKSLEDGVTSESFDTGDAYNCDSEAGSCEGTVSVFEGEESWCRYDVSGHSDCCYPERPRELEDEEKNDGEDSELFDDRGLGLSEDSHIFVCRPEEIETSAKVANGLCHYVGEKYFDSDNHVDGNAVVNTNRVTRFYCCFDSRIGRLLQEGAHEQLGIPWRRSNGPTILGFDVDPDCRGLTQEELQQVNMEQIDFSEVYEQMHEHDSPDTDEMGGIVRDYIDAQQSRGQSQFDAYREEGAPATPTYSDTMEHSDTVEDDGN